MCRFTLYLGPSVRLSTLLTEPAHSLIHQSFHSDERSEPLNGDGFGVGWYAPRPTPEPALFRQITPAWNNQALQSMAKAIASPCVLAHVRAVTPGSDVSQASCHPFVHGRYMMMHNGHVGGFRKIRRRLLDGLTDQAFGLIRGTTDTEHLSAVFVDELGRGGEGGESGSSGAAALTEHLCAALARVLTLVRAMGEGESSFLNVAVTDRMHAAICRFSDDLNEGPESLYYLEGEMYEPAGRLFPGRRSADEGVPVVVSSERLTDDPRWAVVPPNHMIVLDRWAQPQLFALGGDARLLAS